jgi:hypothetical protein
MAVSASRTSSSLNGLMMAITIFMSLAPFFRGRRGSKMSRASLVQWSTGRAGARGAKGLLQGPCHSPLVELSQW